MNPSEAGTHIPDLGAKEQREIRILLVEDYLADAELIERELRKAGLQFLSKRVQTKEFYLQALHEFSPDIILADYTLPDFTGLQALELLQELPYDIPFILVTGSQSEEVAVDCMKQGASDYILKQSLKRLPAAVLNALDKKESDLQRLVAERSLRYSEERFRLLFDFAPLPIWVYDLESLQILEVNRAATTHYGYSRAEFLRLRIVDIQEPADLLPAKRQLLRYYRHHRNGGASIDVQVIAHVVEFFGRRAVLMISEDITERKKAEESLEFSRQQLRQLSAHLQSIREEERARMAREIHDEFGQVLTALKIDTALIERAARKGAMPDVHRILDKTRQMTSLIDLTLLSVRRIATELRPGILDDLGLEAALEWQAQEFQRRTGIRCDFQSMVRRPKIPSEYSTPVFRIFQETLTNITRHADATHVSVSVEVDNKQLSLEVMDNGKGISDDDLARPQSLGILGMKERALLMGAEFSISGEPGHGTKVALVTPLPDE